MITGRERISIRFATTVVVVLLVIASVLTACTGGNTPSSAPGNQVGPGGQDGMEPGSQGKAEPPAGGQNKPEPASDQNRVEPGGQTEPEPAGGQTESEPEGSDSMGEHKVYPDDVMALLEAIKPLHVATSIIVGDETFFIVSYGEKQMLDYHAVIREIQVDGDRVAITSELLPPPGGTAPGGTVYPYAVVAREGRFTQVSFLDAAGDYMPQLMGVEESVKPLLKPVKSSDRIRVIQFGYDPMLISVSGIARVFEATLSYELLDAEGRVLAEGFTTALGGAPDWGYFNLEITQIPPGTRKIVLFEHSMKDGTHLGEVEFEIN